MMLMYSLNLTTLNQPIQKKLTALALAMALGNLTGCATSQPLATAKEAIPIEQLEQAEDVVSNNEAISPASSPKLPVLDLEVSTTEEDVPEDIAQRWVHKLSLELGIIEESSPHQMIEAYVYANPTQRYQNLWRLISERLFITPAHTANFQDYLNYYIKNPSYLTRISERAHPYLYYILQEVKSRQMPYEVALLPIVESGFQPYAKSYQSAAGLWQFMPNTGEMFGLERSWWYDGRQDIHASTQAALNYLQQLYINNNYDWLLALASYNAGYGNVLKAQKIYLKKHPQGDANFWNIRQYLPKETQHYVPQLLAVSYLVKHRDSFNITLKDIENKTFFEKVKLTKQVDFASLAQISETPKELLQQLNPGYLRATTPPQGPYDVLLPISASQKFKLALTETPDLLKIQWTKHVVKPGESLSQIAAKYKTRSQAIVKLNNMKSDFIRVGKTLLIPVPEQYAKLITQKANQKVAYNGKVYLHKVENGESLWTIARYYDITTRELCEWNNIGIREPLRKGQTLKIRSNQYGKKVTYTLKPGESLWTVAQKYKVSTDQLSRWNQISRSEILQPGQKISIWISS